MSQSTSRFSKIIPWFLAIAVLACGIALFILWRPGSDGQEAGGPSVPLVETASVEAVDDALSITQTGFVTPVDSVPVVAEVAGRVVFINPDFTIGSMLSQGDVLFEIDDDVYQADVERAQAQVSQAEARLRETSESLERQSELEQSEFTSEAALQGAQTAQAQASGNLALAEAQLRTARIALEDVTVEAPFDAIVTEKSLSPGQLVQAGVRVGEIAVSNTVEVRIGLSERQFGTVVAGGPVVGRDVLITPRRLGPVMGDMTPREGTIVAISPVLDPQSRTVEVIIHLPRQADDRVALQFNQLVVAGFAVPAEDSQLWRAPRQALQRGQTIWQITADDTLARIDASITRQSDAWVYFTTSDDAPDKVLLTALDAPVDGMSVRVATQDDSDGQVAEVDE